MTSGQDSDLPLFVCGAKSICLYVHYVIIHNYIFKMAAPTGSGSGFVDHSRLGIFASLVMLFWIILPANLHGTVFCVDWSLVLLSCNALINLI